LCPFFLPSHGIDKNCLIDGGFALQSNSDFIILFADDDRIYAKRGYQRADNPLAEDKTNMLLWGCF